MLYESCWLSDVQFNWVFQILMIKLFEIQLILLNDIVFLFGGFMII